VAGQEDQPEDVVLDVVDLGVEIGHAVVLPEVVAQLFGLAAQRVDAAEVVDATPLRGRHQPRGRIVRDALRGPLLERSDQRVLGEVLGQGHVPGHPGQRGDQPG
jgi:hypothetical protein